MAEIEIPGRKIPEIAEPKIKTEDFYTLQDDFKHLKENLLQFISITTGTLGIVLAIIIGSAFLNDLEFDPKLPLILLLSLIISIILPWYILYSIRFFRDRSIKNFK